MSLSIQTVDHARFAYLACRQAEGPMCAPARKRWLGTPAPLVALLLAVSGCASVHEWVHNGFKVGPNFHEPPAAVADNWIDAGNPHLAHAPLDKDAWWAIFHDATLDHLIDTAYRQNLDLK